MYCTRAVSDAPCESHDPYRGGPRQTRTFDKVMKGWQYLRKQGVEFNTLGAVNAANEKHGRRVYRFFRDEMDAK
jgi:uncharacterized protein